MASRGWRHQLSRRGLLRWTTRGGSVPRLPLNFFFGCRGGVDVVVVGTTGEQRRVRRWSRWSPGTAVLVAWLGGEETDRSEERGKEGERARRACFGFGRNEGAHKPHKARYVAINQ